MDPLIKVAATVAAAAALVFVATTSGPKFGPPPAIYPIPAYSQALNKGIAAYEAQVGPTAPKAMAEAAGIRLRSVGFELPVAGRSFAPGPGADQISANCMSCHTPGMILNQPALTRAEWAGEVAKMVKVYKAPVEAADIPAIVTYLASLKVAP